MNNSIRRLLIGRNPDLTKRYLGIAILLFPLGYLLNYLPLRGVFPLLVAIYLLLSLLPAIQAYQNDGLLLSWLLAAVPIFTFILGVRGGPASPENPILFFAGTALLFGAIPGVIGFLVGVGAKRIRSARNPPKGDGHENVSR